MNERLSYANILANPQAAYLFIEEGEPSITRNSITEPETITCLYIASIS